MRYGNLLPFVPGGDKGEREGPAMATEPQPTTVQAPSAQPPTAESERPKRGCLRALLIALAIFVGVVLLAAVCAWFAFDAIDRSITEERLSSLSETEAVAALSEAQLQPPDLSQFAYVSSEGLQGPRFEDVTIGEIVLRSSLFESLLDREDGAMASDGFSSYRVVSAFATWRSNYVEVRRFVVQRFVFDTERNAWESTTSELGAAEVTPVRAPNVRAFQDDVVALLRFHNSRLGEQFADAHVTVEDTGLTAEGGTFEALLEKQSTSGLASCRITFAVAWSEVHGWIVTVESVDASGTAGLADAEAAVAITPQPLTATDDPGEPTLLLACHEGDLVRLTGRLELREDQFVLSTEAMRVQMAGRTYVVQGFVVNAPNKALSDRLGQDLTLEGYISAANAFEDAPLSIMLSSVA